MRRVSVLFLFKTGMYCDLWIHWRRLRQQLKNWKKNCVVPFCNTTLACSCNSSSLPLVTSAGSQGANSGDLVSTVQMYFSNLRVTWGAGHHPQNFWFSESGVGVTMCISNKFPRMLILLVWGPQQEQLQWDQPSSAGLGVSNGCPEVYLSLW